ncbi:MAG: hypothetical protein ACRDYU_07605 [Actinomycetes bacterium]
MGATRPRPAKAVALLVVAMCVCALALLTVTASPAYADDPLGDAADGLDESPLYVHPDAGGRVDAVDRDSVRERLGRATTPVYVAVLPRSAGSRVRGGIKALPFSIYQRIGASGTYAVLVGGRFVAGSTVIGEEAETLARHADATSANDPVTAILDFTDQVEAAAVDARQEAPPARRPVGIPWSTLFLIGGVMGTGYLLFRRRQARVAEDLASVRQVAGEDVTALGADLAGFAPGADPAAQAAYAVAVDAHERAQVALLETQRPSDVAAVTVALEDGRFSLACARAAAVGLPPPRRRPPCVFDPRHGPSVTETRWSPPRRHARLVPVCGDCAILLAEGAEPDARTVPVGTARRPYWDAGAPYGPWAGGYYEGYGTALLPTLLLGTPLGSTLGSTYIPPQPGPPPVEQDGDIDAA